MTSLKTKKYDLNTERDFALINYQTLNNLKMKHSSFVKVKSETAEILCEIISTENLIEPDLIGLKESSIKMLNITEDQNISIYARRRPTSLEYIKSKREGSIWKENEIRAIVNDICTNQYTDLEISMFTLSQFFTRLNMDEIQYLTTSMAEFGITLDFDEPVYDKHSIGGIPGNKVSLVIVPTVAAAGLLIPKTSSRAITSQQMRYLKLHQKHEVC